MGWHLCGRAHVRGIGHLYAAEHWQRLGELAREMSQMVDAQLRQKD